MSHGAEDEVPIQWSIEQIMNSATHANQWWWKVANRTAV